jgi:hypothetical protein
MTITQELSRRSTKQVAEGAAPSAPAGIDLTPLLTALHTAAGSNGTGTISGNSLFRAFGEQGMELPPRDARRLLAVLRLQEADEGPAEQAAEDEAVGQTMSRCHGPPAP